MDTINTNVSSPNLSSEKPLKTYTGIPGRILNMLCSGCSPEEAALAVGVDSSYVRHLKQEPDFIAQIKIKLTESTERAIAIDENYAAIEKTATDRLKTLINLVHSPKDLMQLAAFANSAKKKTSVNGGTDSENAGTQKVVKVLMPTVILNNFVVNPNNEIVQVGERTLETLNSASIQTLANRAKEQQLIEDKETKVTIPNQESSKPVVRSKNYVSQEDLDKL